MSTFWLLIPALVLDAVLGEPKWLWSRMPHPAVLMGRLVGALDQRLNHGQNRQAKGMAAVCVLIGAGYLIGTGLSALGDIVTIVVAAVLLAQRSLVDHVRAVGTGLRQDLQSGRAAVAMIVSRDTSQMTESQIARSAIESGAENLSDGVIAPAFWFLLAGLPGLVIYKMVNTADSMIGYRNEKYAQFGWAAARLDDVLNLAPARLTAVLTAIIGRQLQSWSAIVQDARRHRSPNAGWPEAAMARVLNCALAGPRSYDGQMQQFAWVNDGGRKDIKAVDIDLCCKNIWKIWGLFLTVTVALALIF